MHAIFQFSPEEVKTLLHEGSVSNVHSISLARSVRSSLAQQFSEKVNEDLKGMCFGFSRILNSNDLLTHWEDLEGFITPKAGNFVLEFQIDDSALFLDLAEMFADNANAVRQESLAFKNLATARLTDCANISHSPRVLKMPKLVAPTVTTRPTPSRTFEAVVVEKLFLRNLHGEGFIHILDNWKPEFIECDSSMRVQKLSLFTKGGD